MRVILHSKSQIFADIPGFTRESGIDRPDADLTAEEAGRLCYLSGNRPNPKTATNPDYLLNIENERHYSVLGHAAVTFYIDEITRNCTHEIIRHRWFTFSELSQRYVDAKKFWFTTHPGVRRYVEGRDLNVIEGLMTDCLALYQDIVEYLTVAGSTRKEARQAARHVLPGGTETKILMSGNLRSWRDFLSQRLSLHADEEIRAVALEIYKILKAEFSGSFQDFDSQGMITIERLIQRALNRYEKQQLVSTASRGDLAVAFADSVKDILDHGLWVLKDDPWKEDEIESGV